MGFEQSLQEYRAGHVSLDQLRSALVSELADNPESAGLCLEFLDNERAEGWLAPNIYADLQAVITRTNASLEEGLRDAPTRLREPGQATDSPPATAPPRDHQSSDGSGGQSHAEAETLLRSHTAETPGISQAEVSVDTGQPGQPAVGSILGGQFKLEKELGRGGMGVVFKALDIKAKAANDRNPYVAVKVLSAEFRNHPDSLIQMQREAKKAQSLAHPNIVNVFIFNFDEHCAWIVMEYLDGYPLDELRGKRLPWAKAMSYIEQMANALSHAHNMKPHPIVHYDLKPANVFLTDNEVIKLLDFGIARAAPVGRVASADMTVFDPGALGALTPSYASCEMIRGMDPDPRDDVYGLACVAYFLLTGEHPFDRCPATDAQAARMKPPHTRGLSRRQYKALAHGLEFVRSKRTRSAAQFLRELKPPEKRTAVKALAAATILLIVAVAASASLWLPWAQKDWRVYQTSRNLPAQTEAELVQSIALIKTLSASDTQRIFAHSANVDRLVDHFRQRIDTAFDPAENAYGYSAALAELQQLRDILPNSPSVEKLATELEGRRAAELRRLHDLAATAVREELLVPGDGEGHLPSVLHLIRLLDPYHAELADSRIVSHYANAVEAALLRENLDRAQLLVDAGRELVTEETARNQLRLAESRIEQTRTGAGGSSIAAIGTGILSSFNAALTAGEYERAGQMLDGFEEAGVSAQLKREAIDRLARVYLEKAEALIADGDLENAATMLDSGFALAPGSDIQQSLQALEVAAREQEQATARERRERAVAAIASARAELNQRLDAQTFGIDDVGWAADTLTRLDRFGADTGEDRERVIQRIVATGDALIASGSTAEAFNLGKYADAFFQGSVSIKDLNERVATAISQAQQEPVTPVVAAPEPGSLEALDQGLDALLQEENLDAPETAARIRAQLRRLERGGANVENARERVASAALMRADAFAASGQAERARAHRALATEYGAKIEVASPTPIVSQPVDSAEKDVSIVRASFESAIAAGDPEAGTVELQRLKALLPADDPYLRNDAPAKLVDAYIAAALGAARGRDYDTALRHLDRVLAIDPDDARAMRYQERFTRLRDVP